MILFAFTKAYIGNQIVGIHDAVEGDIVVNVRDLYRYRPKGDFVTADVTEVVQMIAARSSEISITSAGGAFRYRKPRAGLNFYAGGAV